MGTIEASKDGCSKKEYTYVIMYIYIVVWYIADAVYMYTLHENICVYTYIYIHIYICIYIYMGMCIYIYNIHGKTAGSTNLNK